MNPVLQASESQRTFFRSQQTIDVQFRLRQLKQLRRAVLAYEERLYDALWKDLRKSRFEAYTSEIGQVLSEISYHLKKLRGWSRPIRVRTNQLIHLWSQSLIQPEPYGTVLIMAPWNYPFQLLILPLIGAISAGNCATLKASEYAPETSRVTGEMLQEYFPAGYIKLIQGGIAEAQALLEQPWDFIFFTGSQQVGQLVMTAAAKTLTPVLLELGGKSPCIVDSDANLRLAAARIAWGKYLNAGQTCIAPDYLLVHRTVKEELVSLLIRSIRKYFGEDPAGSPDFGRIVTGPKTERLARLFDGATILHGGYVDVPGRYISPTLLECASGKDAIMQEEIFGPVLPVIPFDGMEQVYSSLAGQPKPLALYYFSESRSKQREVLRKTTSGGVCINDVMMQFVSKHLPFGGVNTSGMGCYHGRFSFDAFSHHRAVLKKTTLFDIPVRYPPYHNRWKFMRTLIH